MKEAIKIIYSGGSGEYAEKKSRFLSRVEPAGSREEAEEFVSSVRREYWDASHCCFAYVIGEKNPQKRCSDDGEPSQTAGRPILNVLEGEGITNVCAVVVRYFGGTLLGTGGLVRAYTAAAREGLSSCRILEKRTGKCVTLRAEYHPAGKIERLLNRTGALILDREYTDQVTFRYLAPLLTSGTLLKEIGEASGGQFLLLEEKEAQYGILNGKPVLL